MPIRTFLIDPWKTALRLQLEFTRDGQKGIGTLITW
jgi:hypothetical protein